MGSDRELLHKMVEFFREDSVDLRARLNAAVVDGDPVAVQLAAHSLRGLAANFGADATTLAALRLEEMGRAGDVASMSKALREFDSEISRLLATLTSELPMLQS
jgi:HPt (histidine-containing phosphotransfer) domain-containing protein